MNRLTQLTVKADRLQRRHRLLAFGYAVIKKQGEDRAGYQAALLTYYGFLALFPLLMVATTLTNTLIGNDPELEETVISGITSYFPLLGDQLSSQVGSLNKSGFALVAGLAFAFYGARGVADAFQYGIQNIWQIPADMRDKFPKTIYKSFTIIIVGGLGFIVASICAGFVSSSDHSILSRLLPATINAFVLYWLFRFLFNFSLNKKVTSGDTQLGALIAAVGIVVLQYLGVFLLSRELKNLDALYSYFAIALALLFWLYLQAQILYLSAQIAVVKSQSLWPRSLDNKNPTAVDKTINKLSAKNAGSA